MYNKTYTVYSREDRLYRYYTGILYMKEVNAILYTLYSRFMVVGQGSLVGKNGSGILQEENSEAVRRAEERTDRDCRKEV